jgi:hypothetical protein
MAETSAILSRLACMKLGSSVDDTERLEHFCNGASI